MLTTPDPSNRIGPEAAVAVLVALGMPEDAARRAVDETVANAPPELTVAEQRKREREMFGPPRPNPDELLAPITRQIEALTATVQQLAAARAEPPASATQPIVIPLPPAGDGRPAGRLSFTLQKDANGRITGGEFVRTPSQN